MLGFVYDLYALVQHYLEKLMAISWIVFLIVLAFCTYSGYRRGVFGVLSRLLGLTISYAVSIVYYSAAAVWLQEHTALQGMMAYVVGGIALFSITNLVCSTVFTILQKVVFKERKVPAVVAASGAVVGLALGIFWGLLAVFSVSYTSDLLGLDQANQTASTPSDKTLVERWAHSFVGMVVEEVTTKTNVEPTVAKLGAALVKEPQKVTQQLQRLSQNSDIKKLFSAPENQQALKSADAAAIVQLPEFQQLVEDPDFKRLMVTAGIEANNPAQFEQQMATHFGDIWQRMDTLKNDPRAVEILSNGQFQKQLRSNNPTALLTDGRFMELVGILFERSDSKVQVNSSNLSDELSAEAGANAAPAVIREWTDEQGQKHYSNEVSR